MAPTGRAPRSRGTDGELPDAGAIRHRREGRPGRDRPVVDDEGNGHEVTIDQAAAFGLTGAASADRYDPHATVRPDQMARHLGGLFA